jgi:hypothetical protein
VGIVHFTFDQTLRELFLRFGYTVYRGDISWIPPIERDLRAQLSPEFPFYGKPGNGFRHFLVMNGGKVLGRISAMVNRDLCDRDGTPVGIVGFFECVEDYAVARDLLTAATSWLCEEMGMSRIWGPMNFDIWHGYRFMTKGFDARPFYGEPYNRPYYPEFFLRYGFTGKSYWDSVEVTGRETLEGMIQRGLVHYRELLGRGYRFEHLDMKKFQGEMRKLHRVLSESFRDFFGYTPISFEEFSLLFAKLRYAVDSRFFIFAYDEQDTLAGFAGALLELSDAVRLMSGKDNIIRRIKFLYDRRRTRRINFYIGGMTPEEAGRRSGLGRAGFACVLRHVLDAGYETVLFTLRAKGNVAHGLLGKHAPLPQREYAILEWNK